MEERRKPGSGIAGGGGGGGGAQNCVRSPWPGARPGGGDLQVEEEDSGLAERLGARAETLPQELQGWFVGLGLDAACWVGRLRHRQQQGAPSCEQPGPTVEAPSTQTERHT